MIALVDDLPLVKFSEGSVFAFRQDWLRGHLLKAASRAGYPDWWLADHVTQSVTCYLLSQFSAPIVLAARLEETVQTVLRAIGYGEIGEHFSAARPVPEHSLLPLAELSEGCELLFFDELKTLIRREINAGAQTLHLRDIAAAAKSLTRSKIFTTHCAALRTEIISFVGHFAEREAAGKNLSIILR